MDKVVKHIRKLSSLSKFKPADFAPPRDGLAHRVARAQGRKMKTTQLRKFFGEIDLLERKVRDKELEDPLKPEIHDELQLLYPELAYAVGRRLVDRGFFEMMEECLNRVKTVGDLRRLREFLAAVVAYRKYEGE